MSAYYTFKACICTVARWKAARRFPSLFPPPRPLADLCLPTPSRYPLLLLPRLFFLLFLRPAAVPEPRRSVFFFLFLLVRLRPVSLYTTYHGHCRGSDKKIHRCARRDSFPPSTFSFRFAAASTPPTAFPWTSAFDAVPRVACRGRHRKSLNPPGPARMAFCQR